MIIMDKKKAVQTMMGKRAPEMESSPMDDEMMDGRHIAAQDAISAMDEKSPAKLKQALMNFMDIHNMKSDLDAPEDFEPAEHSEDDTEY